MSKLKESDYIVFSLKLKHDGFIYSTTGQYFVSEKAKVLSISIC
jgi:hypothetical protein